MDFSKLNEYSYLSKDTVNKSNYINEYKIRQIDEFLINKILDNYGYRIKMILLIISSFLLIIMSSFASFKISKNNSKISEIFGFENDSIKTILILTSTICKISGTLILCIYLKNFSRYNVILISNIILLIPTLSLSISFKFSLYIIFVFVSSSISGIFETIAIVNLCECLPIKHRGSALYKIGLKLSLPV